VRNMSPRIERVTQMNPNNGMSRELREIIADVPDVRNPNVISGTITTPTPLGEIRIDLIGHVGRRVERVLLDLAKAPELQGHRGRVKRRVDIGEKTHIGRTQLSHDQWLEVKVNHARKSALRGKK